MDAIRNLCDKYEIEIIASDETGDFTIPDMEYFYKKVYETFVEPGKVSLLDALNVGVKIEKMDIDDLGLALQDMPKDVVRVLNNLIDGSLINPA
jgi:hypothetical protein